MSVYLFVCLFVCLSVCLSICLFVCLFVFLMDSPSVSLPVLTAVFLPASSLTICLSVLNLEGIVMDE